MTTSTTTAQHGLSGRLQRTTLAERASVTATAITQFERGTSRPTSAVLAEMALALGVPADFFRQGRLCRSVREPHLHRGCAA